MRGRAKNCGEARVLRVVSGEWREGQRSRMEVGAVLWSSLCMRQCPATPRGPRATRSASGHVPCSLAVAQVKKAAQEAASIPDDVGDIATVDVIVDVQRAVAKFGWMLGAHIDE